jgi:hypothetical protein
VLKKAPIHEFGSRSTMNKGARANRAIQCYSEYDGKLIQFAQRGNELGKLPKFRT